MTASVTKTSEVILERIDAVLRELQALRKTVLSLQDQAGPSSGSLTEQLLGSLGQAAPDELDDTTDLYAELFER